MKRRNWTRNGALQFLLVLEKIEDWPAGESRITAELLKELQYRAIVNLYTCAGNFRTGPLKIQGVDHQPPPWQQVQGLVDEMIVYVNNHWETKTAVHLCAYLMWRVNWIHPFSAAMAVPHGQSRI